jgi:MoaA/NifB/PqqE/SkfB family radical SAM enzyme
MDAVAAYVHRVCISLDHPSTLHDEIRGIKGLFGKIVEGTRELRRRDPKKQIVYVCTLLKKNVDAPTLRAMAELMGELGVLGVFNGFREEAATDDPDAKLSDWAPSREQQAEAFATLSDLKRRGYPILDSHTYMDMMRQGPPVYRCHWPKFMLPIEANGDVVDCMHWGTRPIGNVKQTPFAEILKCERLRELAGATGEACHKCVSIHRVEMSEVSNGNLEPIRSWSMLRKPPRARPPIGKGVAP